MVAQGSEIENEILATADYVLPASYATLLTYYQSLSIEGDPASSQFVPISAVTQKGRNHKLFAVGILPPSQKVTGRLLDRSASLPVKDLTGVNPNSLFAEGSQGASPLAAAGDISPSRQQVIDAALGEIGQSAWNRYTPGVVIPAPPAQKVSWCGIFCTWALQQGGYNAHWQLGEGIRPPLRRTSDPQPGDIAYFGGTLHHYALVESIEGDTVHTIDGNSTGGKVTRNKRKKKDVVIFFSLDNLEQGVETLETPPMAFPVGVDANSSSTWQGSGNRDASQALKDQTAVANTDLTLENKFLNAQKSEILALQASLAAMASAPPLRLMVNPNKFSVKAQKIASDSNWGRRGPIVEFWGDDHDKISGSGQVAAFYALDANPALGRGGPGLTRTARNLSAAWQNFQSLWLLYKNNGALYVNDLNPQERLTILSTVGSVYIYYDHIMYIGSFDSFNLSEADTKPFTLEYSFEFTVRAAFLLDFTDEYSYGAPQFFTERRSLPIPTRTDIPAFPSRTPTIDEVLGRSPRSDPRLGLTANEVANNERIRSQLYADRQAGRISRDKLQSELEKFPVP